MVLFVVRQSARSVHVYIDGFNLCGTRGPSQHLAAPTVPGAVPSSEMICPKCAYKTTAANSRQIHKQARQA